ncbi:uncharacterized protein PGRI_047080 [Penicillium griseofulvum]|uniref:FAD/NAD(P)-binding domain-containing protein n=1 Tax=Penicillium patulum TaxID=5078 RepID=A0A135LA37_PENPA|nr:uncharacterized protein PGRI_047080 [Penicillium griseofulvum]KXG45852.1 hypothetical protein PGRI_047080 [Penicillium griseofulvum]
MGSIGPSETELGFDPKALHDKYQAERNKRLRSDGVDQYVQLDQDSLDPYVDSPIVQDPVEEDVDFLIMGGGWGGQLIAVRLIQAGITNIRIVEKAGDFGGVWYWNRYPGAACDTESHIYMPLLEELGYMPAEKYAKSPELREHARNIGIKFGMYDKALFQTELSALDWNEDTGRWVGTTNRNDQIRAKFVATASGPLHNAKIPRIPGSETFKGHSFHTNRWDYNYTGGDTTGNLDKISDKRIGIIGTGATAVQAIPHLAEGAKHLYVFQRTPSSIDVRNNRPTDPEWVASLTPGWQKRRMENFNTIVTGGQADEDMVNDNWTDIIRRLSVLGGKDQPTALPDMAALRQLADFQKMEQIRARVDSIVHDKSTADKLKPWYNQFCKRPCFHDTYLPTFNRPNVTLVDTEGQGVEKITKDGIIAGGKFYELDCIIYATGFEYSVNHSNRSGLAIRGREGLELSEKWKNGASTLHGLHSKGFPNLYIVSLLQSGLTPNLTHMLDEQAIHIAYVTSCCMEKGINVLDTAAEAEEKWVQTIVELGKLQQDFVKECTPGYYNNEGKHSEAVLRNSTYGLGSPVFIELLRNWRKTGKLEGLEYVKKVEAL